MASLLTSLFLQISMPQASDSVEALTVTPESQESGLSLWEMTLNGGWIMIPIALLSVIAVYIFVERFITLRQAQKDAPYFMDRIREYLEDGKRDAAIKVCRQTKAPYAAMIEKGIMRIGHPASEVQAAIENVGNVQVAQMEKGFTMLATVASGAPMIGFLGTVTGMIQAFYDMANAGSNVDITLISGGIYQALVTTVAGLVVGIIALFAYNYLNTLLDRVVNEMESKTLEFMDLVETNDKIK